MAVKGSNYSGGVKSWQIEGSCFNVRQLGVCWGGFVPLSRVGFRGPSHHRDGVQAKETPLQNPLTPPAHEAFLLRSLSRMAL